MGLSAVQQFAKAGLDAVTFAQTFLKNAVRVAVEAAQNDLSDANKLVHAATGLVFSPEVSVVNNTVSASLTVVSGTSSQTIQIAQVDLTHLIEELDTINAHFLSAVQTFINNASEVPFVKGLPSELVLPGKIKIVALIDRLDTEAVDGIKKLISEAEERFTAKVAASVPTSTAEPGAPATAAAGAQTSTSSTPEQTAAAPVATATATTPATKAGK